MPKRRSIASQSPRSPAEPANSKRRRVPPSPAAAKQSAPRLTCVSDVDRQAAEVVQQVLSAHSTGRKGVSVKALVLAPGVRASKAVYAVVCKTLQEVAGLRSIAQQTKLDKHPQLTEGTALVLLYEILVGEGLRRKGKAERIVLEQKTLAQSLWLDLEASNTATPQAAWPRYVRVNTIRWSVQEAQAHLRLRHHTTSQDPVMPEVLQLAPEADLHDDAAVKDGRLVLQSRASCLPAAALRPQPGWHLIDACAAPGNKTSHAAALMHNSGTLFAFDKDAQRATSMRSSMARLGASCVHVQHADFLSVLPEDPKYTQVKGVLVDPSCSGSGTARARMDAQLGAVDADRHSSRLRRLADFQVKILSHALAFPAVERLVYSTCSIHAQENEGVVARVLPRAHELGYQMATALPSWPRRGLADACEHSDRLLRVDPEHDLTDGFFIALFERIPMCRQG